MCARPVIALLTDFGTADHYVGVMKGVIAGICPDALTIDITHGVDPQDVRGAALQLEVAWRYFPVGTIFLAVVDPGVGTDRPAVAVQAGDCLFVAPDNGVLDLVLVREVARQAHRIEQPHVQRSVVSRTFEGRDRFAPAAAWLARGLPLCEVGPPVTVAPRLAWAEPHVFPDRVVGEVVHVDRFGNLVTNLDATRWQAISQRAEIRVAGQGPIPVVQTYGEAAIGTLVALVGSSERIEVAVTGGSAAARLGVGRGAAVQCVWRA